MKGHPGVALYHEAEWLTVVVSTGSQYWSVESFGQLTNNSWNNIGIRWHRDSGVHVSSYI